MRKFLLPLLCTFVLSTVFIPEGIARNKFKTPDKTKYRSGSPDIPHFDPSRVKMNTLIGAGIIHGSSLLLGGQLGYRVSKQGGFFLGPELSFWSDSSGSLLLFMVGGWQELKIQEKFGIVFSANAGISATKSRFQGLSDGSVGCFLGIAASQELDDYVSVKLDLRPGVLGKTFAMMVNLNLSFVL